MADIRVNRRNPRNNLGLGEYGNVGALRLTRQVLFGSMGNGLAMIEDGYLKNDAVDNLAQGAGRKLHNLYVQMAKQHLNQLIPTTAAYAANFKRFSLDRLPNLDDYPIQEFDLDNSRNRTDDFKRYVARLGAIHGINPQLILSAWVALMSANISAEDFGTIRRIQIGNINVSLKEIIPSLPAIMGVTPMMIEPNFYQTTLADVPVENATTSTRGRRKSSGRKRNFKRRRSGYF